MKIIILIAIIVLSALFPLVRCFITKFHFTAFYSITDIFKYFRYKKFNNAPFGELVCYCGLFGQGKTLSAVKRVTSLYERYNDKLVYVDGKFVKQRVYVLSNVELLSIPYIPLRSIPQVVEFCKELYNKEDEFPIVYVLGDEFSVQMNSRNFKSNIDPLFLNTLLTCRHYHLSFFLTSQRFGHMDALLRQVTQEVYQVRKLWRFEMMYVFNGWDLENCSNPNNLKPLRKECWFIRDKDFGSYDTYAIVDNLSKAYNEGDMITEDEIIKLQNANDVHVTVKKKR